MNEKKNEIGTMKSKTKELITATRKQLVTNGSQSHCLFSLQWDSCLHCTKYLYSTHREFIFTALSIYINFTHLTCSF